jgi:hypothetical protein
MKNSRARTLLIGLAAGVVYAWLCMLLVTHFHENVSIAYIFVLPVILGAIPVLFSTKEQLEAYKSWLLWPWLITFTFFVLSFVAGFEGLICLVIIVGPFLLLGTLGAFIFRLVRLNHEGNGKRLYVSLALPIIILLIESNIRATDQIYCVSTSIEINANKPRVWENVKNVRSIQQDEIKTHFVHLMGVPKPLNGELDREGVNGIRHITWDKGIKFEEKITGWDEGTGFTYDIDVDPASVPPTTLDEHVMIGGRYFDVLKGSYFIEEMDSGKSKVTLTCTYRVTTNLNFYSKAWADFILNDFNEMILEVIKGRSEESGISGAGQHFNGVDENANCKERKSPTAEGRLTNYPFDRAAQIRLVSFDYRPDPHIVEHALPIKDDNVDTSNLNEQTTLSRQGVDSLTYILYNIGYAGKVSTSEMTMCYDPRNAILFFDESGQVFEFMEICFRCHSVRLSSENIKTGQFCTQKYELLKEFFIRNEIEIGTVKEIEW